MNAWYDRINGTSSSAQPFSGMQFQNPVQKMQYIMQALTNPAAFVKQHFPDIPDNIANDPNQVGPYLQQRLGVSNAQLQQIIQQNPYPFSNQRRY